MSSWLTTTEARTNTGGGVVALGEVDPSEIAEAAAALGLHLDPSTVVRTAHESVPAVTSHVRRGAPYAAVLDLSDDEPTAVNRLRALLGSVAPAGIYAVRSGSVPPWLRSLLAPGTDGARGDGLRAAMGEAAVVAGLVRIPKVGGDIEIAVDLAGRSDLGDGSTVVDLGAVVRLAAVRSWSGQRLAVSHDGRTWIDVAGSEDGPGRWVPQRPVLTRWLRVTGPADVVPTVALYDVSRTVPAKVVCAARGDGLGGRLAALLHAVRIAAVLGLEHVVAWPDALADDPDHAIVPADEFFDRAYWERHGVARAPASTPVLRAPARPLPDLLVELVGLNGFQAPWTPRVDELVAGVAGLDLPYDRELDAIGLAPRVRAAVDTARVVPVPAGSVGLHLRSGDIVFGRYRRNPVHTGKTISVPVARAVAAAVEASGATVVLFGQDDRVAEAVCRGTNTVRAEQLIGDLGERHLQAMAEMVLMSRMPTVVARRSAFAEQAASIGGRSLVDPEQAGGGDGLWAPGPVGPDDVHPLIAAHAAWSAYWFRRDRLGAEESLALLAEAARHDPSNPLYPLSAAALHYEAGDVTGGDAVLVDAGPRLDDAELGDLESTVLLRTGTRYELAHVLPGLRAAASSSATARRLLDAYDADRRTRGVS